MAHELPDTMTAVAIDRFGGIDELKVQTLPVPDVGPDDVLIRVESAGVGVWDPFEREGGFAEWLGVEPSFPYVLGSDGAGTVAAVGENVTALQEGEEVYAVGLTPKSGFYAEYTSVEADHVSRIPGELTVEQAGVLAVDAITGLQGLDDTLGLQEGESIVIFGAGGGIGHLALQLALRMGARVMAVASGDDGVDLAQRLGADAAANGRNEDFMDAVRDFASGGLDAALLTAGGDAAEQVLEAIGDDGRAAYVNGVQPEPSGRSGLKLQGYDGVPGPEAIARLNDLIDSGPFDVHIARTFPLEKAADAQHALDEHYLGKLALIP